MEQEQRESYVFSSYILHIWKNRFLIVLGAIVCMALTAFYVQFMAKEKFRSFAQIMIKDRPDTMGIGRGKLTPVTYKDILLNEDLIMRVRDEYARVAGRDAETLKLEKFKTAFDVKLEVMQDTTIKKEFSPLILLSTDANDPQNAKSLGDIWIRLFMERYGDLLSREPHYSKLYFIDKAEKTRNELEEKETRFIELRWELPFKIRQLTAKELLISPANVSLDFRDQRRSYYKYRQESQVNVQVPEPTIMSMGDGLEDRLVTLEQEIADAQAAGENKRAAQLEAQKGALEKKIQDLISEIKALQMEITEMEKEFHILSREVTALRDLHQYVMDLKNQAEADADSLHFGDKEKSLERMDVAVLAAPNLPELRIFPKKTFSCLVAGVVGFLLSCFFVVFDKFMKESRLIVEGIGKS